MIDNTERNLGSQPIAGVMVRCNLKPYDLVNRNPWRSQGLNDNESTWVANWIQENVKNPQAGLGANQ